MTDHPHHGTSRPLHLVLPWLLPGAVVLTWQALASSGWGGNQVLVAPVDVLRTLIEFAANGTLQADLFASLRRALSGYIAGAAAGVLFGIAAGQSIWLHALLAPTFHAVRQVPVIAWTSLLILGFGLGETFKLVVIALAAFFPAAMNTLDGIRNVPREFRELAQALCYSRIQIAMRIMLPAAAPDIIAGLRLALGRAWMLLVAAELIASESGIGFRMDWGRQMFQVDIVILGIILTALVGLACDFALRAAAVYLTPWRHR